MAVVIGYLLECLFLLLGLVCFCALLRMGGSLVCFVGSMLFRVVLRYSDRNTISKYRRV